MPFSLFFSLLLFLATTFPPSSSITTHSRRSLHEPFFPLSTPPPPLPPPPPSPSIPKYPTSSIPTDPSTPFFPLDPSTPPSPTTPSLPTFPANISSLSFPNSPSTPHHPAATKLLPTVVLPLLALSLLSIVLTFFLLRRRRRNHTNSADKQSLSAAGKRSTTSEFLYLGTLVNSCRRADDDPITAAAAAVSPYYKLSSPELRPLPPLTRQNYANAACSSDEEFYSPRSSSAEKESPAELLAGHLSSSLTTFPTTTQNGGSPSSTLSTPSYPSSNSASSPPIGSSPARSTVKSVKSARSSRSSTERASEIKLSVSTSPPPPPPPPLTPSPPKPKPPFPSSAARISTQRIPQKPLAENVILQPQAAPPPPPPPPAGYWESRVRRPQASQPADLATPVSMELKNFTTGEMSGNSDSAEKREETRPKLKPLHWDKVRASSDRATVWDQLKSSSFQVNEEMIESLFVCNPSNAMPKESDKRQVLTPGKQEDRVLDPKKSHNIAILLRALNVTKEEVCEALMDGNTDSLGAELLETLVKMAPSKEEEIKLKEHKDDSPVKLGPAEKFLKAVLDIPFAFKRVDAMLYIANFDSEVKYLKDSFETLEAACEELRSSRLFLKLLEAVLKSGNRMNIGTNRGDAHAFKLDTLLKLVDIKGADGKTTLLHFVVQEMIRTEGSRLSAANPSASKTEPSTPQDDLKYKKLGLHAVAGLKDELANVKKAAAMDSDVLSSYVSKLAGGIGKVSEVMRLDERQGSKESCSRFHESMSGFLKKAENGIIKVQAQESVALSLVKEITEYFHGNSTKEEAHPFRIFMVVRDFMSILDQVCKEVGRVSQPSYVSSARQLPVPVNPTLLPLFPRLNALRAGSSDDESSSSS